VDDRQNLPQPGGFDSLTGMNRLESIYRKQVALPFAIPPAGYAAHSEDPDRPSSQVSHGR
jgi:hypothetical protein